MERPERKNTGHIPQDVRLHRGSGVLELVYANDQTFSLSAEYLRVYSPSAEVRGHGPGQAILQVGKENVGISQIEAVGHYALRIHFDDGHSTGLYTWDLLYDLGAHQDHYWQRYLDELKAAGHSRAGGASE
ncbi:MAG: DUF971 domain-containing protein [Spiribacter sp.]|jgi:DUF971 family protein|nr:DUF971 domain-containing protein [Spiribacter sp.]MDR9489366.1 DUF971 domain-containing protein [Spiribacter sp.]